jgi:hypothetical protein
MFCPNCGSIHDAGGQFCIKCGQSLVPEPPSAPAAPETSGKAIASLISGILFFIFPAALAAIVLGHISLSEIRKSAGRLRGEGMAITGLVLGYLGVLIIPMMLMIAAIAIPHLLRARQAANEASAVGALVMINTAEAVYFTKYGNGYAPNLGALDGAEAGPATCDHAGLIDGILATGQKKGYTFRYSLLTEQGTELDLEEHPTMAAGGVQQWGRGTLQDHRGPCQAWQDGKPELLHRRFRRDPVVVQEPRDGR